MGKLTSSQFSVPVGKGVSGLDVKKRMVAGRLKASQKGRGSLERAKGGRNLGEKMMLGKNEATRP